MHLSKIWMEFPIFSVVINPYQQDYDSCLPGAYHSLRNNTICGRCFQALSQVTDSWDISVKSVGQHTEVWLDCRTLSWQAKSLKFHEFLQVSICVCAPEDDYAITLARLGTCWRVILWVYNQGNIIALRPGKSMLFVLTTHLAKLSEIPSDWNHVAGVRITSLFLVH